MTLPHHQSYAPDGSVLPTRRRRRVKRVRRILMMGVSCLSVLVLASTGRIKLGFPWHLLPARGGDKSEPSSARHLHEPRLGHRDFAPRTGTRSEHELASHDTSTHSAPSPIALKDKLMEDRNSNKVPSRREEPPPAHRTEEVQSPFNFTFVGNSTTHLMCSNGQSGVLNDNYCDCPDGSDEVTTSACSHLIVSRAVFRCEDGVNSTFIYASRVGDGIVDCPNGSDERKVPHVGHESAALLPSEH
jgi:Glucosidase II beta subunit-like